MDTFAQIANHMKEGIDFHDQVSRCYDFMGIRRFARDHSKHFMEESESYRSLLHYYSTHYHKLLKIEAKQAPNLIPESWYKYDTFAVDMKTKMNYIQDLTRRWIDWERQTQRLYQDAYLTLMEEKDVAGAYYVYKLVKDVTKELKEAEQLLIDLESIGYDMPTILTGW